MIERKLKKLLNLRRCTLLGVGPMSLNCVDAAIELANENEIPLFLIASRRQVDSADFGGGYVNNWTTEEFSNYVFNKDKKGKILLARDHGGPWQNNVEKDRCYSLKKAMESAKLSYKADINSGFQVIHIDPSVDIYSKPSIDEILDRVFELYEYCWSYANSVNKEIIFEIGTEEQSGSTNTQDELDYTLNSVTQFCIKNKIPQPTFVVIQCGTRVLETKNIGSFDSPIRVADEIPAEIQLPKMIEICNKYGILMKEHNTDYLSDEALHWHPRLGIHAANVAPEFGVTETKALLNILEENKLDNEAERFLKIAFDSKKWEKWMLPNSKASDRERALIAGHYVFSNEDCIELKKRSSKALQKIGIDLEVHLKEEVKKSILRYLRNFRLVM
jgi:tagatose-1,6-bisphosphate aldolase non-catalytic subunit AgaZ/GatZ